MSNKSWLQIFWGCLLLFSIISVLPPALIAADDYQQRVQGLLDNSQYKEAIRVLEKEVTAADDGTVRQQIFMKQAEVYYYYMEDYHKALASYKSAYNAADTTKTAADALYRRGLIYMDKLEDKNSAVKEFEVVYEDFPQYHKRDELKGLLKGTLSRAFKLELIERKNYWKFFICLIDAFIIFLWKVIHEYVSKNRFMRIAVDTLVTLLVLFNVIIWWIVSHAEAQLDMLSLGIIK